MLHCLPANKHPLKYISSGNLISENGFVHPHRNLDTFVLLYGLKGEMQIAQGGSSFVLKPHTYIVLFPGLEHWGICPSEGELSYFWCHFQLRQKGAQYLQSQEVLRLIHNSINSKRENMLLDVYVISEYGEVTENGRAELLFHQVLDIAREGGYSGYLADYALSLLMMELSNQFFLCASNASIDRNRAKLRIFEITEWLRTHYSEPCTLQDLAVRFCFHPAYLSSSFKKNTGISLLKYVTKLRVAAAKKLLMSTEKTVAVIAKECGFSSDKHFMKVFKTYEFTTPSQYRYSFVRKKINKE